MSRILSVEDSEESQLFVATALKTIGCEITRSYSVVGAREKIEGASKDPFDLVILDMTLPDGDAFAVMKDLQECTWTRAVPVLLLTGNSDLNAKLSAFDLGAEDYLLKPIDPRELRARVQMRLKKRQSQPSTDEVKSGKLILRPSQMAVYLDDGKNSKVELTSKEFKILSFLMKNEGNIYSRQQLVQAVWGTGVHVLDRTVDSHVCGIRRRLGTYAPFVESLPHEGYRFNPQAKPLVRPRAARPRPGKSAISS